MSEQSKPASAGSSGQLRTLAVRITEELRAQLDIIAQLTGRTATEEIRLALEHWIDKTKSDPAILKKAEAVRAEIDDRGLRTRQTPKRPSKQVSINTLSLMLKDRYYIGRITYKGEEYPGRHEPLVDEDLFDEVQSVMKARAAAGERRRVHHHYLKGSVFCGRCRRAGINQRLNIQHTVNPRATPTPTSSVPTRGTAAAPARTPTSCSSSGQSRTTTPR